MLCFEERYTRQGVRTWVALGVLAGVLGAGCTKPFDRAIDRGNALARDGKLTEAQAAFSEAIALEPDSARAHFLRGNTLMSLKKPAEAEPDFRRAAPSLELAREALAATALKAHDAGAALEWVAALPSARAKLLKGRALLALGRPQEALDVSNAVPGPEAQYLKGSALLVLKRYPEAKEIFSTMAQATFDPVALKDPRTALGPYGLARLEVALGHGEQALGHLKQAQVIAGAAWEPETVEADPAFAALSDAPTFKQILRPPP